MGVVAAGAEPEGRHVFAAVCTLAKHGASIFAQHDLQFSQDGESLLLVEVEHGLEVGDISLFPGVQFEAVAELAPLGECVEGESSVGGGEEGEQGVVVYEGVLSEGPVFVVGVHAPR